MLPVSLTKSIDSFKLNTCKICVCFFIGSKEKLKWGIRYKIALGAARGLLYLHEGCQRRIIHRDIKAANILLTEDFEPQVPKALYFICL